MKKISSKHNCHKTILTLAAIITIVGAKGFSSHAVIGDSIKLRMENMLEEQKEAYLRDANAPVNTPYTSHTATNDLVKQRMEAMPEERKKELLKIIDSFPSDTIHLSRTLTPAEEKRRSELTAEYVKGKFPEYEITMVRADKIEDLNNLDKDTLYYVYNRSRIYYPERELTDEEHLQVIDLFKKQEYVVAERYERDYKDEIAAAKAAQQKASEACNINQEKAIAIADEFRSKVLGLRKN